jgi:quercetin dioxygenase-like cupin family protein
MPPQQRSRQLDRCLPYRVWEGAPCRDAFWTAADNPAGDPGARWRLDGEDLQANLIRLDQGDRIQPHRNDEVEVLAVVVSGRGELTLDGQVHQLAPMVIAHLPKGRP